MQTVELIELATTERGVHRVWAGVFAEESPRRLEWRLNGAPVQPERVLRPLARVPSGSPRILTHTTVVELPVGDAGGRTDRVSVTARGVPGPTPDPEGELRLWHLPDAVPEGLGATFNVLAVSCFYEPEDSAGRLGELVDRLARGVGTRPDLVLAMGDQVYLDNPPLRAATLFREEDLSTSFERKYRRNWQGNGYARILRAGPVATLPDDHEYWNNYPQRALPWAPTLFARSRENWASAARNMFDAFQLGAPDEYSRRIDVAPLSFLLLDTRTFRTVSSADAPGSGARARDLDLFAEWVEDVLASEDLVPVLVTAPSLFQSPKGRLGALMDRNISNLADYPTIMQGLLRLSSEGRPPLALTGDVHYGRLTRAVHSTGSQRRPWSQVHEVISSPSSLVASPMARPTASAAPRFFDVPGSVILDCEMLWPLRDDPGPIGDHVALLRFSRTQRGVELDTTYWTTDGRPPVHAPRLTFQRFPVPVS